MSYVNSVVDSVVEYVGVSIVGSVGVLFHFSIVLLSCYAVLCYGLLLSLISYIMWMLFLNCCLVLFFCCGRQNLLIEKTRMISSGYRLVICGWFS